MFLVVFLHVEIDAALALVGEAVLEDFLDELDLFDDVSCGMGFDAGGQAVQGAHGIVESVGVVLCHFHGFQLLQTCLLRNLVLALVGIVLQV